LKAIAPWLSKLTKAVVSRRGAAERDAAQAMAETRPFSEQQVYAQAMQALVEREVQTCLLFSGSLLTTYNYASQFQEVFAGHDFVKQVEVQYCPEIDHHDPAGCPARSAQPGGRMGTEAALNWAQMQAVQRLPTWPRCCVGAVLRRPMGWRMQRSMQGLVWSTRSVTKRC
jgi:hypothetical protein